MDPILERIVWAVGLNLALGTLAFLLHLVNKAGWLGGMFVGILAFWGGGWQGYVILWFFFMTGTLVSKHGLAIKASWGGAQEEEGRRGAKHALANCAAGVLLGILAYIFELNGDLVWSILCKAGLVGAFATAISDTTANELGQLYGKHPILPTTLKPVPVGTEGAVSVEGTLFGVLASLLIGLLAWLLPGLLLPIMFFPGPWQIIPAAVLGAFLGSMFESYLGATLGQRKIMGNEAMNFTNTVVGGVLTAVFFYVFSM